MKTKNLFFLILILGLSFNSFSQEEVTIKQVLKNISTSDIKGTNDQISIVEINTSIPVTINKGEENAIYLTGEFDSEEDYAGFCRLNDGFLRINNPKKGKKITLELASDVIVYQFFNNANVVVNKDVNVNHFSNGIFEADNNSSAIFYGKVRGYNLYMRSKNNSRLSFISIESIELEVELEKGSEVILKGNSETLKLDKDANSKFIKDTFAYSSLFEAVKTYKGDTISHKEYNKLSNTWNPNNADLIIGKNSKVKILFSDKIKENYISNYPIKGYEKGKLIIQDDYPIDLVLTIKKDIGNITLKEGAKVIIDSEIKEEARSYYLYNNSELIFNKNVEVGELDITLNSASKASFKNLKADKFILEGNGSSELEINGEIGLLERNKYDDVNLKGDYKIDSIKERKLKTLEVNTYIPLNINTNNAKNFVGDENSEKIKAQKLGKDKVSIELAASYGVLNWSNRVSSVDYLFSSPSGQYSLNCGSSWNLGFRYEFNLNRRLTISTGLGYESNIFRFKNNVMLTDIDGEKRIGFETKPSIDAESKLVARYVTIPLFIKYRVVKDFTVHVGAIAGVNFRTSSTGFKRNYDIPHGEVEERWGANYSNFKPIKLDVQAGIGWDDINLYVKYALTPLFKNNKEIEVYPYSFGISFGI